MRLARDNPTWGYTLHSLGHSIGRTTIRDTLKRQGIDPAPSRREERSWSDFLRAHWSGMAACDFFTVEVLTWRGLVRHYVCVVIDVATRRGEIGGVVRQPTGAWMLQVARNLLDADDGFLRSASPSAQDAAATPAAAYGMLFPMVELAAHDTRQPAWPLLALLGATPHDSW